MKPVALHERIRAEIEGAILSGALPPGARIPSEAELMTRYQCARMTVNKALSTLAAAGLLDRRRRAGSFVARPRTESQALTIPDLPVEVAARGQVYGWSLLSQRHQGAAPPLDWAGHFVAGERVLALRGLHLADGQPLAWEERLISLGAVPDIDDVDFAASPPGSWLLHHIPWTAAQSRIGAANAPREVARALGAASGAACLTLERRTWRGDDSITLVRQYFLAGRYELTAHFGPA